MKTWNNVLWCYWMRTPAVMNRNRELWLTDTGQNGQVNWPFSVTLEFWKSHLRIVSAHEIITHVRTSSCDVSELISCIKTWNSKQNEQALTFFHTHIFKFSKKNQIDLTRWIFIGFLFFFLIQKAHIMSFHVPDLQI